MDLVNSIPLPGKTDIVRLWCPTVRIASTLFGVVCNVPGIQPRGLGKYAWTTIDSNAVLPELFQSVFHICQVLLLIAACNEYYYNQGTDDLRKPWQDHLSGLLKIAAWGLGYSKGYSCVVMETCLPVDGHYIVLLTILSDSSAGWHMLILFWKTSSHQLEL